SPPTKYSLRAQCAQNCRSTAAPLRVFFLCKPLDERREMINKQNNSANNVLIYIFFVGYFTF
ncbi:hypothetical protein, partial [Yersinia intermedia]|uniref:hypothetical protein n=1 Tax=Yersinia intermedia TaxID=631 RepID=UPI001C96199F